MSHVVVANTTNVTHGKSQANDSLNQFIKGSHHLFERTSSKDQYNSQNNNPEPVKKPTLSQLGANAFHNYNNIQPEAPVSNCMRLNSLDSVIVSAPDTGLINSQTDVSCHCLSQQQPLQQQSCNRYLDDKQLLDSAGHKTIDTVSSLTSNCSTAFKTSHNNIINNHNNNTTPKGLKRANEASEPKGRIPVIISASHPLTSKVSSPSSGNSTSSTAIGSSQKQLGDCQSQPGEGETGEEEDSTDEESNFEYEPVLFKILNEKKLALSKSPNVIKFLSGLRKQQRQTNCP